MPKYKIVSKFNWVRLNKNGTTDTFPEERIYTGVLEMTKEEAKIFHESRMHRKYHVIGDIKTTIKVIK